MGENIDEQELLLRIKSSKREVHSSLTSALELLQKRSGAVAGASDGPAQGRPAPASAMAGDFASQPAAVRRRQLVVSQAKALEADAETEIQDLIRAVSREDAEEIGKMELTKDLRRAVADLEKNDGEWFRQPTNADQALRKVQAAWREAVERASSLLEACTLPPADLETQILESESRLMSLQDLLAADASLALWEADEGMAKQALQAEPTDEELEAFMEANAVALQSFLSSEEELLEFLDSVYGETARQRQESMRLLSKAVEAVDAAMSEPAAEGEGAGLSPRSREDASTSLMEAAKDELFEVAAEARQRAERFKERDFLLKRLRIMQKEANAKGMRGDQVTTAAKMERARFTVLKGHLVAPTGSSG